MRIFSDCVNLCKYLRNTKRYIRGNWSVNRRNALATPGRQDVNVVFIEIF